MEPLEQTRLALELIFPDALLALGGEVHLRIQTAAGRSRNLFYAGRETLLTSRIPRDEHVWLAPATRMDKNGKGTGCVAASAVWVDVDVKVEGNLAKAEAAIESFGLPPSMIVSSGGGGRHFWWLLRDPVLLATSKERAAFKSIIGALAALLSGDPSPAHAAAVMRLPGTRNVKPEYGAVPPLVEIVAVDPAAVYDLQAIVERLPAARPRSRSTRRSGPSREAPSRASVPGPSQDASGVRYLNECLFVRHCADKAAELGEGLWVRLAWVLVLFGDAGRAAFHRLSEGHPTYTVAEADRRFDYGASQGYTVTCTRLVEHGFTCPNLDHGSGLCTIGSVRRPADLIRSGPTQLGGVVLRADRTLMRGAKGIDREVASFRLAIDEERGGRKIERRLVGRAFCPRRPPIPFDLPAVVGGDRRLLARSLAELLGTDYRVAEQHLGLSWNAWLAASDVRRVELSHDFGFDKSGTAFVGLHPIDGSRPTGPVLDLDHSEKAKHLGLRERVDREVNAALSALLHTLPEVGCGPFATRALLATATWALVAPVMEAHDPAIPPLCVWLLGPSGAGKSTTARVVQSIFGEFMGQGRLVSFGSTAQSVEEIAHWFRGALLVIDDAKRSAVKQKELAGWLAVLQRLHDRTARGRLRTDGKPSTSLEGRATVVVEGEETLFQEASIRARYFQVEAELQRCTDPEVLARLLAQARALPGVAAAQVRRLLAEPRWPERLHVTYVAALTGAGSALPPGPNRPRISRSIAALVTGWSEFLAFAVDRRVIGEVEAAELLDGFIAEVHGSGAEQSSVATEATAAHRWLEDLRSVLATGDAEIDGIESARRPSSKLIGFVRDDTVHVYPTPSVELCNERLHRNDERLPSVESIGADLDRLDWLARRGGDRPSLRLRYNGTLVSAWALRRSVFDGDDG